jgi:DNA-binding transcriptional LysR family regulator
MTLSTQTPQQALAALLDTQQPGRLLVVAAGRFPALDAFMEAHPDTHLGIAAPGTLPPELARERFDLAMVVDCLEHLTRREGQELLGGIRNLNASRLAVLADLGASPWAETDFFALALQKMATFQRDEQTLGLFTYDVREYKQAPDWLNARFWANPQHFDKYWW